MLIVAQSTASGRPSGARCSVTARNIAPRWGALLSTPVYYKHPPPTGAKLLVFERLFPLGVVGTFFPPAAAPDSVRLTE